MIASLKIVRLNSCSTRRDCAIEVIVLLANLTDHRELKKRSPSVWRYHFVFDLDGPTISRREVGPCAVAVMQRLLNNEYITNTFTRKGFLFRRSRVQSVVSARL
jgi:hypothetical protein